MDYQTKLLQARRYYESLGYKGREAADLASDQLEHELQEENLEKLHKGSNDSLPIFSFEK